MFIIRGVEAGREREEEGEKGKRTQHSLGHLVDVLA
jgi:hypothetical protein